VIKKTFWIILCVLAIKSLFGQVNIDSTFSGDSTKARGAKLKDERVYAIKTIYLLEDSALFKPNHYTHIDTTLPDLDLLDEGMRQGKYLRRINNFGSASYDLEFHPMRSAGYNLGLTAHAAHHIRASDLRYYDSYTPYTQLRYIQGDGELQILDAFHSQSFGEQLNLGITYHSIKSTGFYLREANRVTNVAFQLHYKSLSGKYQMMGYGIWNTNDLNENGGVTKLDTFSSAAYLDQLRRLNQPTFLPNQNGADGPGAGAIYWLRNMEMGLRQIRYIGPLDSIPSVNKGKRAIVMPRAYATHKLKVSQNISKFSNNDTLDFFPYNYSFGDRYFEVLRHQEISNELGIGIFFNKREVLLKDSSFIDKPYAEQVFYGGVDFRAGRTGWWGLDNLVHREPQDLISWRPYANLHIFANLSKQLTKVTHFKGDVNYVLVGNQFSDYNTRLALRQQLWKKLYLKPFLQTQAVSPTGISQTYLGAMFRWVNDLKKQFNNELGATLSYRENNHVSLSVRRSDNFIYFNQDLEPAQSEDGLNYVQLKLRKDLHLGKFHFENEIAWQQMNDGAPYRVPAWLARLHYYFESPLFKQAVHVRIGARVFYYSSFNGLQYMPGLAAFYVGEDNSVGNYPQVDVYLAATLKKWNGFLKYSHVNDGLLGYDYEMLPGYPMAPRALRMGVAWRFYN